MWIKDKRTLNQWVSMAVTGCSLLLAACSGGGSDGGNLNLPPTAAFTATPARGAAPLIVSLDASASDDPDGAISSYRWDFGDGSPTGSGVSLTHTFEQNGVFEVRLTVLDDQGASASFAKTVTVSNEPPPESVTVSGRVTFDRVPFSTQPGGGLDYAATYRAPARQVSVQAVRVDQSIAGSTVTDNDGNYSVNVAANTDLYMRVRAQSVKSGPRGWNLSVMDNTAGDALYVLDGSVLDTGESDQIRNLHAASGWPASGGTRYTGVRAAAPFAILDTLYGAVLFVAANAPDLASFPALGVFWSVDNRSSGTWDPDNGNILTTLYSKGISSAPEGIYVLGQDGADTDEYDQHVLAHEFHHYLEANLFRFDSPGGSHAVGEKLDLRVSFSEGFANAFSGMVLADPIYRDSGGAAQREDLVSFDFERDPVFQAGWFNEGSVHSIVWDIFDSENETGDGVSAGYAPMFDVLRNEMRDGQPLSSLFPFIVGLKQRAGVPVDSVDQLVAAQGIVAAGMDRFGSTETGSGGVDDVLPLYTDLFLNDNSPKTVCSNVDAGINNKIGNRRLLKFSVPTERIIEVRVTASGDADPDLVLFSASSRTVSDCSGPDAQNGCTEPKNIERYNETVGAGDYVLEVFNYSHLFDPGAARTCMDIQVTG